MMYQVIFRYLPDIYKPYLLFSFALGIAIFGLTIY